MAAVSLLGDSNRSRENSLYRERVGEKEGQNFLIKQNSSRLIHYHPFYLYYFFSKDISTGNITPCLASLSS